MLARLQGRMVQRLQKPSCCKLLPRFATARSRWNFGTHPKTIERRQTDAVSPAPGTVGLNLDRIRPAVFAHSIAPRLGIEMPRVKSGTYASATISTSLTADAKDKSARQDATAAALESTSATVKRVSARLAFAIEDIAAVGQENFEPILRDNLSLVLSDALDDQAINGNGVAPNLTGILQRLTDPADPATAADFDAFAAAHAGGVDGLWSNTLKEVSIVVGPENVRVCVAHVSKRCELQGRNVGSGLRDDEHGRLLTNKRMPDPASDIQQAIVYRMGRSMMGGAGAMRTAVCPHWNEISIDDIYSGSASGERFFTMHVLLGDVILVQPAAYSQIAYRLA